MHDKTALKYSMCVSNDYIQICLHPPNAIYINRGAFEIFAILISRPELWWLQLHTYTT